MKIRGDLPVAGITIEVVEFPRIVVYIE